MSAERIAIELEKLYGKIDRLMKRAKELEEQKKQAEDMEYVRIIRKHGISAEELQGMIKRGNEEQQDILKNREKEQEENEALEELE